MYNINWARGVAKAHYEAYPRASYILLTSTHFTSDSVARWVAKSHNDPFSRELWCFWKLLVEKLQKRLDQEVGPTTKRVFSKQARSILSEVFWSFDDWGPDWLLTAWQYWEEHEQQFLQARPPAGPAKGRLPAEPGQLDFSFEGDDESS